jgi:hypothetical protein
MSTVLPAPLPAHERVLLLVERLPWSAVYRAALGYAVVPTYVAVFGLPPGWGVILWFLAVLVALRMSCAVARKAFPFSAQARDEWAKRRMLAKRFDSYQWQKLTWFGVGLAVQAFVSGAVGGAVGALTMACLIGGFLGLITWQRARARGGIS